MSTDVLLEGPKKSFQRLRYMGDESWAEVYLGLSSQERAFYGGYSFFAFHEFNIAAASPAQQTIKIVSTTDTIVRVLAAELTQGDLTMELVVGGTEGGSFTNPITVYRANQTSVAAQRPITVTMNNGGSHTGGTVVDKLFATSSKQTGIGSIDEELPIGFGAGTFYIRLLNTGNDAATGAVRMRWESL